MAALMTRSIPPVSSCSSRTMAPPTGWFVESSMTVPLIEPVPGGGSEFCVSTMPPQPASVATAKESQSTETRDEPS